MPRKRHQKKQPKPLPPEQPGPNLEISPAAQQLIQRIATQGNAFTEENFERIMIESSKLAGEPEFIDLTMDESKVLRVSSRWASRFEKRLEAAELRGPDEFHQTIDDMRIKIIDELATPLFRKEIKSRLQALQDRLLTTSDVDKLEVVLMLQPMLSTKEIPWGICGLVLAIYDRTTDKAMQPFDQEDSIVGFIEDAAAQEGISLDELLESPERFEQFAEKLMEKEDWKEKAEDQAFQLMETFEQELFLGNVDLDLFTEEELLRLASRPEVKDAEQSHPLQDSEAENESRIRVINEVIQEIMTPERTERMRKDAQKILKSWYKKRHPWAAMLEAELVWMESLEDEVSPFLMSVFTGQIRRVAKGRKK